MTRAPALPFERPLGTTVLGDGRVRFRVWAPKPEQVAIRLRSGDHALTDAGSGVWEGVLDAAPGDDYWVIADGRRVPDPCTRWQPKGLRGPSRVVDPATFAWTDEAWDGVPLRDAVIYELHVGTFTPEGTFDAAIRELPRLAALGVTAIELMPVAEFPGEHGWGYDGVYLWAAHHAYGGPEALARLVDAAHRAGIAVILDVVYNHVGASGERALRMLGPFFTDRYSTFWGEALNYDGEGSGGVREWVLQNAEMWVRDLHVDGLRLDAIHAIFDGSAEPLLAELATRVRAVDPRALIIAESGRNDPQVMRPRAVGGLGHDAAWADDFHHALRTLLTGEQEGYYEEFGSVADLAKAWRVPHVHDGGWSTFRGRRFGAPAPDLPPEAFVVFSANHDQVGNRALGDRLPPALRPLAAFCTLLSPFTPMLFMGEEYGEAAPFQFFSDHIDKRIAKATRDGRRREFAAFAAFSGQEVPDPQDRATFLASKLVRTEDAALAALHADLLALRAELTLAAPGHAEVTGYDEAARWLRVRRGTHTLIMSFSDTPQTVPAPAGEIVLATAPARRAAAGLRLAPMSGVVIR
ncbi:malto-oligosyltrehalose trehalohydrolase [Paraconexibacter antarcticus]|uniref:Malto-oligosyltrehalose trehalohydrolase n=1 Tax=Paraconexibacter antarcticus TaxID=2949664 RepID=A0ABY5DPI3_9ACTN|nr:malto-oligosyltrehalose trehalohydrolase [Paraconexibacter antarcticus]UTI62977.1 malto-oligosyltrehalose trehalohydrolase [Paraconexibacter antarcticus]